MAAERSPSQQLSQPANWDVGMAGDGAISKLGILAALLDPEALNRAQDTSIFSRQDSPVLVFREQSSAKQRDLCNFPSQYSEPGDYAVTLSPVCGEREEFRSDEGRPRDGLFRVRQLHGASR